MAHSAFDNGEKARVRVDIGYTLGAHLSPVKWELGKWGRHPGSLFQFGHPLPEIWTPPAHVCMHMPAFECSESPGQELHQ